MKWLGVLMFVLASVFPLSAAADMGRVSKEMFGVFHTLLQQDNIHNRTD